MGGLRQRNRKTPNEERKRYVPHCATNTQACHVGLGDELVETPRIKKVGFRYSEDSCLKSASDKRLEEGRGDFQSENSGWRTAYRGRREESTRNSEKHEVGVRGHCPERNLADGTHLIKIH